MSLVSVILPVYNGERFLKQSIDSILSQTFSDFELIIINDGSTDNSENIILSYIDDRIRYIKNPENLGLIKTLNKGIKAANGKFIARMDADDIAEKMLLEKEVGVFIQFPDLKIVNVLVWNLNENGTFYKKSTYQFPFNHETARHTVFFYNCFSHPGIMVNAETMKTFLYADNPSVKGFEDMELWSRILFEGHFCFTIEERLVFYRTQSQSIVSNYKNADFENQRNFIKDIFYKNYRLEIPSQALRFICGNERNFSKKDISSIISFFETYTNTITKSYLFSEHSKEIFTAAVYYRIFAKLISSNKFIEALKIYIKKHRNTSFKNHIKLFIKNREKKFITNSNEMKIHEEAR